MPKNLAMVFLFLFFCFVLFVCFSTGNSLPAQRCTYRIQTSAQCPSYMTAHLGAARPVTLQLMHAVLLWLSYLPGKAPCLKWEKWSDRLSSHLKIIKFFFPLTHCKYWFILVIGKTKPVIHLLILLGKEHIVLHTLIYVQGNLQVRRESGSGCWKVLLILQYS